MSQPEQLPPVPPKRYFTIGEVSQLCVVKPHVLRYWEQEFPQLKPAKRRGNRRYYQQKDILLVRKIRDLLYHEGFTIQGARQQLAHKKAEAKASANAQANDSEQGESVVPVSATAKQDDKLLGNMLKELQELKSILENNPQLNRTTH